MGSPTRPPTDLQSRSPMVIRAVCCSSREPVSLYALRRFIPGCGHALCAGAGQAGRDISIGLEPVYPAEGIADYPREQFIEDLLREHETEMRRCLQKGSAQGSIDFTEARLAVKIDPSGQLLGSFVDLNNLALSRFSPEERERIGIHTCPGVIYAQRIAQRSTTPICCPGVSS